MPLAYVRLCIQIDNPTTCSDACRHGNFVAYFNLSGITPNCRLFDADLALKENATEEDNPLRCPACIEAELPEE